MYVSWALEPMTGTLRREDTERHREEGHMKSEAETEAMLPQAEECPRPSKAGRGKAGAFPRAFGGSLALKTP